MEEINCRCSFIGWGVKMGLLTEDESRWVLMKYRQIGGKSYFELTHCLIGTEC